MIRRKRLPGLSRYVVTDDGRVLQVYSGREMRTHLNDEGYPRVQLVNDDGEPRNWLVHRLVALAFLPAPRPGQMVLHGNDCRTDCTAENLRWGTHHDNHDDKRRRGRLVPPVRKLTRAQVREIRASKLSAPRLAKRYRISISHAREVKNGRKWKGGA